LPGGVCDSQRNMNGRRTGLLLNNPVFLALVALLRHDHVPHHCATVPDGSTRRFVTMSARASLIPVLFSAEDLFPLCFSRTTSNNKTLPTAGLCSWAPPLLLQGLSLCVPPTARLHGRSPAFRLVLALALTPSRCLLRETGMPCFSPTSRCRPLTPSRGLRDLGPLNTSPPLLFQVLAPKNSSR
jgi:hypothetical protein